MRYIENEDSFHIIDTSTQYGFPMYSELFFYKRTGLREPAYNVTLLFNGTREEVIEILQACRLFLNLEPLQRWVDTYYEDMDIYSDQKIARLLQKMTPQGIELLMALKNGEDDMTNSKEKVGG